MIQIKQSTQKWMKNWQVAKCNCKRGIRIVQLCFYCSYQCLVFYSLAFLSVGEKKIINKASRWHKNLGRHKQWKEHRSLTQCKPEFLVNWIQSNAVSICQNVKKCCLSHIYELSDSNNGNCGSKKDLGAMANNQLNLSL